VAQSWVIYRIFKFLTIQEVTRLQGLNRLFYSRRIQQYLGTFRKKHEGQRYSLEDFEMPHRAWPQRKMVLRDCEDEVDDEPSDSDSDVETPKSWLYTGDKKTFKTEEFRLEIPWCTCSDGPHFLKVKEVFNFEKAIMFFNRRPTKC